MNESIVKLESDIYRYNDAYRKGQPLISDEVFDQLVDQLRELNPESDWFKKGVQDKQPSVDRKEKLPLPMFSLEKVKSHQEILRWIRSIDLIDSDILIVTPKYDGISLCVSELEGRAWTRGDGEFGQKCDKHFAKMKSGSWKVSFDEVTFTFGEAIFKTVDFLKVKEKSQYKSARNAVAGLLNSPEPSDIVNSISYVRYGTDRENYDKKTQLEMLTSRDANVTKFVSIPVGSLNDEEGFLSTMNKLFETLTQGYKCDGLVIEVNDAKKRRELGRLTNNNPRYAIAYKNPEWSEREETIVENVKWQISKDGKLAPVVEIKPVELCGATVSKCTAYNAKYVVSNNIVAGARVVICRSGDVIPKHLKTLSSISGVSKVPAVCPICGKPLSWDSNNVDLHCTNENCSAVRLAKCVYFFSTFDFKEFRESTIRKIFDTGYTDPLSIMSLSEEELSKIEGIGKVAAKVLSKQFEDLKKRGSSFSKYLTACNYFNGEIAEKTCQKILNGLGILNKKDANALFLSIEKDEDVLIERISNLEGIGSSTAQSFLNGVKRYIKAYVEIECVLDIKDLIPITKFGIEEKSFEGQMTVVFTGFRDKSFELELVKRGYKITNSVSKKTTCVITREKGSGSTKETKADSLGIPIFTLSEFKSKFFPF